MPISVLDSSGNPVNVEVPNPNGQATMANSKPVVIASNQSPISVQDSSGAKLALDGTDITGAVMPTGGVGHRGWLSAIYTKLAGTLTAAVTGTVSVSNQISGYALDGTDITGAVMPPGGVGVRGWLSAIKTLLAGVLSVSQGASTPTTATLQNNVSTVGAGTLLSVNGMSVIALTVNITSVATVVFEGTEDGTNFTALNAVQLGTTTIASSVSASGISVWEMPVGGLVSVRARVSAYTSGNITVTGHAVPISYNSKVVKATIDQTTPGVSNAVAISNIITGPQTAAFGSAATYANNTQIGPVQTFTVPSSGLISDGAMILASGSFAGTVDIVLFNAAPGGTYNDQGVFTLNSSDYNKLLGVISFNSVSQFGITTVLQPTSSKTYEVSGTTIWAVAVIRGSVILTAANQVQINLQVVK